MSYSTLAGLQERELTTFQTLRTQLGVHLSSLGYIHPGREGAGEITSLLGCRLKGPKASFCGAFHGTEPKKYDTISLDVFNNRPFPSSLVPLFQNESKCETFLMKMSSACSFIFMQIKVIFKRMVRT